MDTDDIDDLKSVVRGLDRDTLATGLLEVATDDELVRRRLQRLRLAAQRRKLAAAFRATLSGWRRGTLPQHDLEPHAALEAAGATSILARPRSGARSLQDEDTVGLVQK